MRVEEKTNKNKLTVYTIIGCELKPKKNLKASKIVSY